MPLILIWCGVLLVCSLGNAEYASAKDYERAHRAQYGQVRR